MNLDLFRRSATRANFNPGAGLYSDQMLAELLALHEEMIAQLRLERLGAVGSTDFLTGMIAQHEKAAAMLRAQLENREAPSASHGQAQATGTSSLTDETKEAS